MEPTLSTEAYWDEIKNLALPVFVKKYLTKINSEESVLLATNLIRFSV